MGYYGLCISWLVASIDTLKHWLDEMEGATLTYDQHEFKALARLTLARFERTFIWIDDSTDERVCLQHLIDVQAAMNELFIAYRQLFVKVTLKVVGLA